MEFKTKHIGAYGGNPASIIELTVISDGAEITEDIISFKTSEVDESFITSLRELADELEEHNNGISNKANN